MWADNHAAAFQRITAFIKAQGCIPGIQLAHAGRKASIDVPWRGDEPLSPEAVHLSDPGELKIEAARLVVSSGRQVVAEVSLNRPRMVLGRDTSCDISLDSRYVSRYQNLFMETAEGWVLIDLGSTNGCFVNGRRVREHRLRDGDLIAIGHHQLRFSGPQNRLTRTTEHLALSGERGEDTVIAATPSVIGPA